MPKLIKGPVREFCSLGRGRGVNIPEVYVGATAGARNRMPNANGSNHWQ